MSEQVYTKNKPIKIKTSKSRLCFNVINTIILTFLSLTFLLPIINTLAVSLSSKSAVETGVGFLPINATLAWYKVIVNLPLIWNAYMITIGRTVIGSLLGFLVNYCAAYALSRKTLPFRQGFAVFLSIPMFVSAGLIPQYITYSSLGLLESFWIYIIPLTFSYYNVMIMRAYITGIPESLRESARLDGASEFIILFKIMIPLSKPIIATILLWTAVGHWNNWTDSLYFVPNTKELWSVQYYLYVIMKDFATLELDAKVAMENGRLQGTTADGISYEAVQAALIIFTSLPIMCAYPFFQKYFVSGTLVGGVKE